MSNYINDIRKQNAGLRRKHKQLIKEIEGLKKLFKETHKNRPDYPEVTIESSSITVGTRKLRVRWTAESAKDMQSYHNVNIGEQLSETIQKEIDDEITKQITEAAEQIYYSKEYRKKRRR